MGPSNSGQTFRDVSSHFGKKSGTQDRMIEPNCTTCTWYAEPSTTYESRRTSSARDDVRKKGPFHLPGYRCTQYPVYIQYPVSRESDRTRENTKKGENKNKHMSGSIRNIYILI